MTESRTLYKTEIPSLPWHTSSYSLEQGECVEVAEGPVTAMRDTKHRDLGMLTFPFTEWQAFLGSARKETC
ncbi:DUF397 domain-containing protein [Nocardiopsis algeriensis]|uniref:DUF397 domain-containing protein n=1 Tax=Nocardiopsis algeriensis TaxID=1478215 RepID=UPI003B42E401